jgi:hypothetical protein
MITFSFNTLDRIGLIDRLYVLVANLANKHILSRHNFDTEYIANVFNALDGFWLKYGRTQEYSDSEVRVIVGTIIEMLRDNKLSSNEVRKLSRYVMAKWKPDIAEQKAVGTIIEMLRDNKLSSNGVRKLSRYVMAKWKPDIAEQKAVETLLPSRIEEVAKKSVKIYRELPPNNLDVTDLVSIGTKLISDSVPESQIFNLFSRR